MLNIIQKIIRAKKEKQFLSGYLNLLCSEIQKGGAPDLKGANFEGVNLSTATLKNIDLRG
jgi:uncharacterized protein YjbI with pentapeptide repeats